jgi:uncharacterized phosphosugar-binding protein
MLARRYLNIIHTALNHVSSQAESFSRAGKLIVDSALKGGHLYVHDLENVVTCEAVTRAGGLSMVRSLRIWDLPAIRASTRDVVIVFTNKNEFVEAEFIKALKEKKMSIIGVCPLSSTNTKEKLSDYSDVVIDNSLSEYDGVIEVPYFGEKLGQIDTVINSAIVFSICEEVIAEFLRRGLKPSTLQSIRTSGGVEYDARITEQYRSQGF